MMNPQDTADLRKFAARHNVNLNINEELEMVIVENLGVGRPRAQVLVKHYQSYNLLLTFKSMVGEGEACYTLHRQETY